MLKGSKIIKQQISILKAKGLKFDYKVVTNSPNSKVLEELDKCDIFIDELESDICGFNYYRSDNDRKHLLFVDMLKRKWTYWFRRI